MADLHRLVCAITVDNEWDLQIEITRTIRHGFLWLHTREERYLKRIVGNGRVWRDVNIGGRIEPNSDLEKFACDQCYIMAING
jgi:hypothetical protein